MDRREALKKLGVGSAVAVSAPVLLDAFNVAHACSTDVTAAEAVLNPPVVTGKSIQVSFNVGAFNCASTPSFVWRYTREQHPMAAIPAGSTGTITRTTNGNLGFFTIEVDVLNGTSLVSRYELIGTVGLPINVIKLP